MVNRADTDRDASHGMEGRFDPPSDLDAIDMRILAALVENSRITWRHLSDHIGLSLTPTLRRVRRLESAGYIEGYTATLDERRLLGGLSAFIQVTLEKQSEETLRTFESQIESIEEVASCFMMTGNVDYLMRVVVRDLDHYQKLLTKLTSVHGVAHVNSSFALKAVIKRPAFRRR